MLINLLEDSNHYVIMRRKTNVNNKFKPFLNSDACDYGDVIELKLRKSY